MELQECGKAWVADLMVEGANHYISETGLINKNTRIYVEELGNFPSPVPVMKLMATLRSGAGVPVGMRCTGNPGGPGHGWVRARYIDPAPMGWKVIRDKNTQLERIYIPSRVQDNRYLGADYVQRLKASGSPELVRAWLEGDWSVVSGAFFPEFSMDRHVIAPRTLPEHWAKFRSFDWGSARPFCCQWWAVSDGSVHDIARGALVLYREWYGMRQGEPNVGLKLTAEAVAAGIRDRELDDGHLIGVADPAMFAEDGGPSIAQRMISQDVVFRPADNKRVPQRGAMGGWDQLRSRLVGDADGRPMILFFSTARDLIRTLPAMQHDDARPEDVDCWVAGTMVETPSGPCPIEQIQPGDVVDTPVGPRPVLRSYLSGASETVRIMLADGRVLEGTPHHKVYVEGRGLVALADLSCHLILKERIRWSRSLNTAVSFIAAMKAASTTIRAAVVSVCTGRFGLTPATAFPMAGTFTTGTAITTTTPWPTSNAYRVAFTPGNTWSSAWPVTLDSGLRHGVARGMANDSFARTPQRCSPTRLNANARATIVALLLLRDTLRDVFAPKPVRKLFRTLRARCAAIRSDARRTAPSRCEPARIIAVGRCGERTPVYNLTVADAHLFYANGVISSNTNSEDHSADAVRYACMSRPYVQEAPVQPVRDTWAEAFERAGREHEPAGWRVA